MNASSKIELFQDQDKTLLINTYNNPEYHNFILLIAKTSDFKHEAPGY